MRGLRVIPGVRMRSPAALGGVRGELLELGPLRRGCGGGKVRRGRCHLGGINFPSRLSSEGRGPGRADRSPDRPDPPALCSIPGWSGPWRLRGLTSPRPVSLRRLWVWFPARQSTARKGPTEQPRSVVAFLRVLISLSYKPSISSLTRCGSDPRYISCSCSATVSGLSFTSKA